MKTSFTAAEPDRKWVDESRVRFAAGAAKFHQSWETMSPAARDYWIRYRRPPVVVILGRPECGVPDSGLLRE